MHLSRFRAARAWSLTGLDWLKEKSYEYQVAARDFIARSFSEFAKQEATVSIALTGQTVLDNTCGFHRARYRNSFSRINLPADIVVFLQRKQSTSLRSICLSLSVAQRLSVNSISMR